MERNNGGASPRLALWGVWEWWCDIGTTGFGGGPRHTAQHAGRSPVGASPPAVPPAASSSWIDQLKSVAEFDTAEGFWALQEALLSPSQLPPGAAHYVLRKGVPPLWEHEMNRRGGRCVLTFDAPPNSSVVTASDGGQGGDDADMASPPSDRCFVALCAMVLAEQLPGAEEDVLGVSASRRKNGTVKIGLWLRTGFTDAERPFREEVRNALGALAADTTSLQFIRHDDATVHS